MSKTFLRVESYFGSVLSKMYLRAVAFLVLFVNSEQAKLPADFENKLKIWEWNHGMFGYPGR